MSRLPLSRSADLGRLVAEGYTVRIAGSKLVIADIPFVDHEGVVHRDGVLVMPLTLAGDVATAPGDHTASFAGGIPCDANGSELSHIINGRGPNDLGDGVIIDCTFSMKPGRDDGKYVDFHDKVTNYVAAIAPHAATLDSSAVATVFRPVVDDQNVTPFHYLDSASSRSGIDALNEKLERERVAIVGVGGTGEYILDFVAKTRVAEIHVFDEDTFLTHNAFRAPGAPTLDDLNAAPLKVDHFAAIYSRMHKHIVAHPYSVTRDNVDELSGMTFAFVSVDDPTAKKPIIDALLDMGIAFVDVGMGVEIVDGHLTGIVRTTLVTPETSGHVEDRISMVDTGVEGEYRSNIQIAELNARNASDAVIRWKKYRGVYADLGGEHFSALSVSTNHVFNGDGPDDEINLCA